MRLPVTIGLYIERLNDHPIRKRNRIDRHLVFVGTLQEQMQIVLGYHLFALACYFYVENIAEISWKF